MREGAGEQAPPRKGPAAGNRSRSVRRPRAGLVSTFRAISCNQLRQAATVNPLTELRKMPLLRRSESRIDAPKRGILHLARYDWELMMVELYGLTDRFVAGVKSTNGAVQSDFFEPKPKWRGLAIRVSRTGLKTWCFFFQLAGQTGSHVSRQLPCRNRSGGPYPRDRGAELSRGITSSRPARRYEKEERECGDSRGACGNLSHNASSA